MNETVDINESLMRRLEQCNSRKAARKSIEEHCDEFELDPCKYVLPTEALFLIQGLH
jgi:hypothetical protein